MDLITSEDIRLFCKITGDENKAHQGNNPVVPGFMIDFLAKSHFDEIAKRKNPDLNFSGLNIKFKERLHNNQPYEFEHTENFKDDSSDYEINMTSEGVLIAKGAMHYRLNRPSPEKLELYSQTTTGNKTGRVYLLTQKYFENVCSALRIPFERMAGAVSRTSHALQNDNESQDIIFGEASNSRQPFFARHELNVFSTTEQALDENNMLIYIRKKGERKGTHYVSVQGASGEGKPIFDLTAAISFETA